MEIGHLAPVPFTREAVDALSRNVAEVRSRINAPLILENITYSFPLPGAEMSEADFLSEVLERIGCGLLLDVTNLHVNAINHGYDPATFLERLPLERVAQLHFVGPHRHGHTVIDSHSHATTPEIWALLDLVVSRAPVKGIILERDENLPPFGELADELHRARAIGRRHARWD